MISSLNTSGSIRICSSQKMDDQMPGCQQRNYLNGLKCIQEKEKISFYQDTLANSIKKEVVVDNNYLGTNEVIINLRSND
jgi:hypothetical protein